MSLCTPTISCSRSCCGRHGSSYNGIKWNNTLRPSNYCGLDWDSSPLTPGYFWQAYHNIHNSSSNSPERKASGYKMTKYISGWTGLFHNVREVYNCLFKCCLMWKTTCTKQQVTAKFNVKPYSLTYSCFMCTAYLCCTIFTGGLFQP